MAANRQITATGATKDRVRRTRGPGRWTGVVLAAGVVATACVCSAAPSQTRDEWFRQHLVGTWKTRAFGDQVLTNFEDGTARLDVSLNRLAALRYGRSLQIDLEWSVEDGVLRHKVTGGSPPDKVQRLVNDFGGSSEYEIVEVTDAHLLLEKPADEDAKQQRWEAQPEA